MKFDSYMYDAVIDRKRKGIIHKTRNNMGQGWTLCHKDCFALRTRFNKKVTCKKCLKMMKGGLENEK